MYKRLYIIGIVFAHIVGMTHIVSANFVESTGLATTNQYNFSTKIDRLTNGNLILAYAQYWPSTRIQFYTSNDDGTSRSVLSFISTNSTYGADVEVLDDGTVLSLACNYGSNGSIYRSTDDGTSRNPVMNIPGSQRCIHGDFIELNDGSVLAFLGGYANVADRIYRSTDNGISRAPIHTFPATSTYKLDSYQLNNGDIIHVSIGPNGNSPRSRIRRSVDNGASWTLARSSNAVIGYDSSVTQATDGSVIATFATAGNDLDTYRSIDNGQSRIPIGLIGGNTTYYGTDIITLSNGMLIASFVDSATKQLYKSTDHGQTRTQVPRPTPITTASYANDLFQSSADQFLISDGHRNNRPAVYKYNKPLPPVVTNIATNTCAPFNTINGIGEGVGNTITYTIKDINNNLIENGTTTVNTNLSWSASFTDIGIGTYNIEAIESDTITSSDPTSMQIIINNCNTVTGENQAPIIQSNGGSSITTINGLTGTTTVTTVAATDDAINIVGIFGNTTTTGNTPIGISHDYDLCEQAVTVSHRQAVTAEIQRYPRIINKTLGGFTIKVDNYNSTIGNIPTIVDYVAFAPGNRTFNNGLKVQAGIKTIASTAVACASSPNAGIATQATETFTPAFSTPPVVLHSIGSNNDASRVMSAVNGGTRRNEPSTTSMGLHMGRSFNSCNHDSENIDYIAREPGHRSFSNFEVDAVRSPDTIRCCNANGRAVNFYSPFNAAPSRILVAQLGEDGGNGGYAMIHNNSTTTSSQLYATIDEEGPGADRTHTTEVISAVSFSTDSGVFIENNTINYSLSGGADVNLFTLTTDGVLSFINTPNPLAPNDANNDNTYEVIVAACDNHCNQKCDTQLIKVVFSSPEANIARSGSLNIMSETHNRQQILTGQYSDPNTITIEPGYGSGLYTTLSISNFNGNLNTLPGSIARIKAGPITTISGGPDNQLSLASGTNTYQTFTSPITRRTRTADTTTNGGVFGTLPMIELTLPPYTIPDNYQATITYTLYEN